MSLLLKTYTLLQTIEETSQGKLIFDSIENWLIIICSVFVIILIMLIPAVLCFSMIDNYFSFQKYSSKIDKKICCQQSNYSNEQIISTCNKYLKSYSRFIKNFSGLAAWNIFSLLYIAIGFPNLKTGLLEYFSFPFYFIKSFYTNSVENSFTQFSMNWYAMTIISILTIVFFLLGNHFGSYFGKINLRKRALNVSLE